MQSQVGRTKGELKGEFRGKRITATFREVSANGIRFDNNDEGEYKEGKFDFRYMQTISVLLKPDGTSEWESKGMSNTMEGDTLVYWGNGTAQSTGQNTASWEGELHRMTTSPRLSALNNTTLWIEAKGNMATGEYTGKAYAK
jgi:hypothetical protein